MPDLYEKVLIVGEDGSVAEVVNGELQVSGGGGGGGAVTIADGADVAEGSTTDAPAVAGGTGTVSAKLRLATTQLASILNSVDGVETLLGGGLPVVLGANGGLKVSGAYQADDPITTSSPVQIGGRASTAVPSAVSADGDAVAAWLTRTGARVVDGGVASGATDSGNPVKVGGKYNSTRPTYTDGQRTDLQSDTRGNITTVLMAINGGSALLASNVADGATGSGTLPAGSTLYNGGSWDLQRANVQATLLASAARTATTSSSDQVNYNGRGVLVVVNVTAESGTTTLTLTIEGKDSISSNYYSLITGIVVYNAATDTPTVTRGVLVYPGVLTADAIGAGNANLISAKALALPRTWRATITPSDASSQTYSVSGVTIV